MQTFQGDPLWDSQRTGNPTADWLLLQQISCRHPEVFWSAVLRELGVGFHTPPDQMLIDNTDDPDKVQWLPGARLNIAHCALHCPKVLNPDSPAIVWADEQAPTELKYVSWAQLQQRSMHVAACVAAQYQPGDALAIAMPLSVEAVVIYFGVVLAGCVVVSIADSFATEEVTTRLCIAKAKAIFTQDILLRGGKVLPLYSRVTGSASVPTAIVVSATVSNTAAGTAAGSSSASPVQAKLRDGDMTWQHFLAFAEAGGPGAGCALPHMADAGAYSNILFSSGTTGEPKAIPWTQITPLRCAVDGWSLQNIQPGNVVAWPTNLGWMMGPWLLYASLLNGATMALYQGAPSGRDFGQFVAAAGVNVLGLVPSIVKSWRLSNCMSGLDWSSLKCFSSTGEASCPDDCHWLASRVKGYRPIIEYCGGTEIGGGFLAGCLHQPQAPSLFSTPTLGANLALLTPEGHQSHYDVHAQPATGELTLVPPMLGSSQALLNASHTKVYYQDMPRCNLTGRVLRRHGDEVQRLPGGYYRALGRCDDTMNLGGIKVSAVELERVIMQHVPGIAEVAAVGIPSPGGGPELLYLFVVPSKDNSSAGSSGSASTAGKDKLLSACQVAVRSHLNPLFKVDRLIMVESLPRTASNKVMRRVLRSNSMQQQHQPPRSKL
eukprot:GHRR01025634.1.p1 GENE.GHRR01025634.1~~GHRR01025634.1.p1  ORF type:complete len:660 (+),score=213.05 GHRR01025634.1:617-2596(+)